MDSFVFAVCQFGAEQPLKQRLLAAQPAYRLAFSRPGLLTLKWTDPSAAIEIPAGVLVRLAGHGIGSARSESAAECFAKIWEMAEATRTAASLPQWDAIHVFERDRELPGSRDFEPGESELTDTIAGFIRDELAKLGCNIPVNETVSIGQNILDIVLAEPNQWLAGRHKARSVQETWPGAVPPIVEPEEMVSRAYLKLAEALLWSGFPIGFQSRVVEIGSAPGGACQRLLDLGCIVTGVDAAEMDERLLANANFEHWRSKAAAVKRKLYKKFQWLVCDANVAPNYTLDVVGDIVTHADSRIEGMLLTLKLSSVGQLKAGTR
ncbi:MAG: hypothetical protein U0892_05385 [Pirellulales bacterium]